MERQRTEISAELLAAVRELAEAQGRSEAEGLEEAVAGYLSTLRRRGTLDLADVGRPIREIYVEPPEEPRRRSGGFLALLDRMSSRFDLDGDEAMRVAVEEQQAFRRERRRQEAER